MESTCSLGYNRLGLLNYSLQTLNRVQRATKDFRDGSINDSYLIEMQSSLVSIVLLVTVTLFMSLICISSVLRLWLGATILRLLAVK